MGVEGILHSLNKPIHTRQSVVIPVAKEAVFIIPALFMYSPLVPLLDCLLSPIIIIVAIITTSSTLSYLLLSQHLQLAGFGVMRKSGGYYDVLLGHVVQREGAQGLQLKTKIYYGN